MEACDFIFLGDVIQYDAREYFNTQTNNPGKAEGEHPVVRLMQQLVTKRFIVVANRQGGEVYFLLPTTKEVDITLPSFVTRLPLNKNTIHCISLYIFSGPGNVPSHHSHLNYSLNPEPDPPAQGF